MDSEGVSVPSWRMAREASSRELIWYIGIMALAVAESRMPVSTE